MNKTKFSATLNSRNFLVSIMSILFLIMGYMGADVTPAGGDSIVDAIFSGNVTAIIMALFVNFVSPLMKIIAKAKEKGGIDLGFLKSLNFWVQAGTVILLFLGTVGLLFPENAISEIVGAIQSGDVGLIIVAFIMNLINPVIHFIKDRKPPGQLPKSAPIILQ